eukprot:6721886-Pyramimonas_sp.AAC.1
MDTTEASRHCSGISLFRQQASHRSCKISNALALEPSACHRSGGIPSLPAAFCTRIRVSAHLTSSTLMPQVSMHKWLLFASTFGNSTSALHSRHCSLCKYYATVYALSSASTR